MRFHIVKREGLPLWKRVCFYLAAVIIALGIGAILLACIGVNPFSYYYQMFTMGTVGNRYPHTIWMNYFKKFLPLVLTSVALSLAFKMKFWNIGGEGQFIIGALTASFVALTLGKVLPQPLTLLLMCVCAMLAAGLYGLVAGFLKVKFGTNETLMTLMLNYIALYILVFFGETKADWNVYLQAESTRPVFENFSDLAAFPTIDIGKFRLDICLIFTLIIGVLVYIYLRYTKHGYEISVIGDSADTARYAGMRVKWIILRTVFLSAALIGLAAAFKVGSVGVLSTSFTNDVGWTGIIVAWLSQLHTGIIFVVSALISVLQHGSEIAATTFGKVDSSFANMLQGAILFLVLAADFFTRFRIMKVKKGESDNG